SWWPLSSLTALSLSLRERVGAYTAPDLLHDQVELDRPPDAVVPADHGVQVARLNEVGRGTLWTDGEKMRRDGGRLHAGGRGSGEFDLHVAGHVARAAVSLILGEGRHESNQVMDRMEGRGRRRFVEEEDVRRQRVHVATSQRVESLRLTPAEMF